jgi:hypothetical protein
VYVTTHPLQWLSDRFLSITLTKPLQRRPPSFGEHGPRSVERGRKEKGLLNMDSEYQEAW